MPDRREFLGRLVGGAAAVALFPRGTFPAAADDGRGPMTSTRLGDNLLLLSGAGGNVVLVIGTGEVALVNGGLEERSADLLKAVAELSGGKRVATLFNTDWHPEHTGSNAALGQSGATIVAHEHTKQYIGADLVDWDGRKYKRRPSHALPTRTFYTAGKWSVGDEPIEYAPLGPAHTDGDIHVLFPRSNVLVAGDVLSVGSYPIADHATGGWLGGLVTATKTLLDLSSAETRVVPGVGPLQARADVEAQHTMLAAVRDRLVKMMRQGMGPDDMLAAGMTSEFDARWGDPRRFVAASYRGMWLHVRELGGIV